MSDRLTRWLEEIGLGEHAKTFVENDIDFALLTRLSADDLKELGLSVGHRRRFLDAAGKLKKEASASPRVSETPAIHDEAERRQISVVFCDLVGSTELSQKLDPEDLREIHRAYQDATKSAIERYEGYIARYSGDGVLAYFGYPQAHEDDAERAVRAGRSVVEAVHALNSKTGPGSNVDVAVRVGIATGPVVAGDLIGEGAAQESAVVGETPNLAARLQSIAAPNSVVVAPDTQRLAAKHFQWRNLGEQTLKGFAQPVVAWEVSAESPVESRFEARLGARSSPLVGRDEELAFLSRCWRRAKDGEGQLMLISGEPGIGKSRLCEAFATRIATEPHLQLRYQCSPHYTGSAFYPVIRHFENSAGMRPDDEPKVKLNKLERLLQLSEENVSKDVPLLAALLSIPLNERYRPIGLSPQEQKERLLQTCVRRLERLAARQPVLVLFEDLHWADPSTLEVLDRFVEILDALPMLMLITFRPEFKAHWPVGGHVIPLTLNRLSNRESRVLVSAVTGTDVLPENVIDDIVEKTDGVPLFIEEVGHTVVTASRERDALTPDARRLQVPATLESSLMARLDRLTTGKQVAQTGAAIGREFTGELLRSVCELETLELTRALDELLDKGLLARRGTGPEATYQFKHALLQEAAYNSLLRAKRRPLHRRIAEALTARNPQERVLLAHHWEHAGELETALDYRIRAAEESARRHALWEAIAQYWCALELLERLTDTRENRLRHLRTFVPLTQLGPVFWRDDKKKEEAARHMERAIAAAMDEGDLASLALLKAKKASYLTGDEATLAQAVSHAEASGDKQVQALVASNYSGFLGQRGRFEDSHPHADRSVELFGALGDTVSQAVVMAADGRCYRARAGKLDESLDYARRARRIAERYDDRLLRSWLAMESEPYMYKGLWEETVKFAREGLPVAWEIGNYTVVLFVSAWAAIACVKLGRPEEARALLDEALQVADKRVGWDHPRAYPRIALAQLHLATDEIDKALSAAQAALELAESAQLHPEQSAAYRVLGEIYERKEDRKKAYDAFSQSLEILGRVQSRPELAQSLLSFGRFRLKEDPDEGRRLLRRALNMFEDMDATGWVEETKAELTACDIKPGP